MIIKFDVPNYYNFQETYTLINTSKMSASNDYSLTLNGVTVNVKRGDSTNWSKFIVNDIISQLYMQLDDERLDKKYTICLDIPKGQSNRNWNLKHCPAIITRILQKLYCFDIKYHLRKENKIEFELKIDIQRLKQLLQ
jgi:hypothetical protein